MAVKILLNEIKVSIILSRLCQQLIERHKDFSNVVLVGLQPRGTTLLEQLLKLLKEQGLKSIKSGKLDITFFRDDFRRNDEPLYAKTTEMSETLEGKDVVLIDDVLFTGRTVRSAIDALMPFGRPNRIELLTLIDRRFQRQLPIEPNYVGKKVDSIDSEKVIVNIDSRENLKNILILKST